MSDKSTNDQGAILDQLHRHLGEYATQVRSGPGHAKDVEAAVIGVLISTLRMVERTNEENRVLGGKVTDIMRCYTDIGYTAVGATLRDFIADCTRDTLA